MSGGFFKSSHLLSAKLQTIGSTGCLIFLKELNDWWGYPMLGVNPGSCFYWIFKSENRMELCRQSTFR